MRRDEILERMRLEGDQFAERLASPEVKEAIAAFFARRSAGSEGLIDSLGPAQADRRPVEEQEVGSDGIGDPKVLAVRTLGGRGVVTVGVLNVPMFIPNTLLDIRS